MRARAPIVAILCALALIVCSLLVGAFDIMGNSFGADMFWITRVPRTVTLMLAGSVLAVSGLAMQRLTQNHFVDATTSGTTEWAALGLLVSAIIFPTGNLMLKMVCASAAAFLGAIAFFAILRRIQVRTLIIVPVVGLMLGAIVSALTLFIAAESGLMQMLSSWFTGSVGEIVRGRYEILWIVVGVSIAVWLLADRLTVAGLGEDVAIGVGIHYHTLVLGVVVLVSIAAGITTAVVGYLPLIGIIVPHLVSRWFGDNVRRQLPWVLWGGMVLVLLSDLIGRIVAAPFEMPVSLVLGVVGAVACSMMLVKYGNR